MSMRTYFPGIGKAVADRTINRKIPQLTDPRQVPFELPRDDSQSLDDQIRKWAASENLIITGYFVAKGNERRVAGHVNATGHWRIEDWIDVADRVSAGNASLVPKESDFENERLPLQDHMRRATVLLSGRHLQHGDLDQKHRPGEIFTNCATACASFISHLLLLEGSGVGRDYSDELMVVDWSKCSFAINVIRQDHPDVLSGSIRAPAPAEISHLLRNRKHTVHMVEDSREGFARVGEVLENSAFLNLRNSEIIVFDWSQVRHRGQPIRGMQNRPASGPGPTMEAVDAVMRIRSAKLGAWEAAMQVDHAFAISVLVGDVRRAARLAAKWWKDNSIFDFISLKRTGQLWSANNSVMVDREFWTYVNMSDDDFADLRGAKLAWAFHAKQVFQKVMEAAYYDRTGEPGFINGDRLVVNREGMRHSELEWFIGYQRLMPTETSRLMFGDIAAIAEMLGMPHICNPCGEIGLYVLGGYCTIADVVPFHAESDEDAEDSFRVATRALIRTNLMEFLYDYEVKRTNRIGVGFTGIFEYAWSRFKFGWKDLVNEEKSIDFWMMMSRFARAVKNEAKEYSEYLGVVVPHTDTTCKPAGTTSKLFGLCEGAHLPAKKEYMRWVQFHQKHPMVAEYRKLGYPTQDLRTYQDHTIVGFPTRLAISQLGMGDALITAADATPQEQFQWLRLLEKYWLRGVDENGESLAVDTGNQVSYTLKFNPDVVSYDDFCNIIKTYQPHIKCCTVMPECSVDDSKYEYLPEQEISAVEYEMWMERIQGTQSEDIAKSHIDCENGACPVDFGSKVSLAAAAD